MLQSKITSWTSDYLVVCAFMAVAFNVIGDWIIPMLVECAIMTVVTFCGLLLLRTALRQR